MGSFRPNRKGIQEICKSAGMQAALLAEAEKLAARANARASGHGKALHITEFNAPPYAAHVDVLSRTAVGAAHTNGKMGWLDQAKFKSLSAQNHGVVGSLAEYRESYKAANRAVHER